MKEIKLIIWDLDDTLANTKHLKSFRDSRQWSYVFSNINSVKSFNGIVRVFNSFKTKYRQCVVTNSPRKYAESVLEHLMLVPDKLISYNDTSRHKPNPEPFLKAMSLFNVKPHETVSIGDNENDFNCSVASGCCFIGVSWGELSKEQFLKIGVKLVVTNSTDLLALI